MFTSVVVLVLLVGLPVFDAATAQSAVMKPQLSPLPRLKEKRADVSVGDSGSPTSFTLPSDATFSTGGMKAAFEMEDILSDSSRTSKEKADYVAAVTPLIITHLDTLTKTWSMKVILSLVLEYCDDETVTKLQAAISELPATSARETALSELTACRIERIAQQPLVPDKPFHKRFPPDSNFCNGEQASIFEDEFVTPSKIQAVRPFCKTEVVDSENHQPVLLQPSSRACGPTAVMMVMLSLGIAKTDVCNNVETAYGSGASFLANMFNQNKDSGFKAEVQPFSAEPSSTAATRLAAILAKAEGVIALLSGGSFHYIVVDNVATSGIRIRDPFHGWEVTVQADAFFNRIGLSTSLIVVKKVSKSVLPSVPGVSLLKRLTESVPPALKPHLCRSVSAAHQGHIEQKESTRCSVQVQEGCLVENDCCWRQSKKQCWSFEVTK